jgi:23S rRNA pseudouridine1911/1915/1917 synthase
VVEKPVNILSQGDATGDPDLLSILKEDLKIRHQKPGNVYLGLVHRLDRPVGGVMVFAKTSKAAARLSEQIREQKIEKVYLAVIRGIPSEPGGFLEHLLLKDPQTNIVSVVADLKNGAKKALLAYETLKNSTGFSLVKIKLHTGRSHQIRVQFATTGHPLYGDQKYGADYNKPGQQLALWSHQLVFLHPTRNEKLVFESFPPNNEPWSWFDN